jgi:hypothetical protein
VNRLSVGSVVIGAGVFACFGLLGQTTGTILGRVVDQSGSAVPRASIQARNSGTGLVATAVSNEEGIYLAPALPPGTYELTVSAAGLKTYKQSGIQLEVDQNARVDAVLQVGPLSESIAVQADALSVDTQSTTLGATVDNRRMTSIPLNGRNVLSLAQLLPGVGVGDIETTLVNARSGPSMTISGNRVTDNNLMLDGTSMVELMYNYGINLPNPDAVQEFRVLTNTYSAEYGRASGGVFLAVSKSGSNDVHGSSFEFLRNDNLNARNFFAPSKPFLRQNQFGGSIGGPVILPKYNGRNHTFIFGSYQGVRVRQQTLMTSTPATAQENQGDFSAALPKTIKDPTNGLPFPGNLIPANRLDSYSMNLAKIYMPLPNQPDGKFIELRSMPTTGDQYVIKGDHIFSQADRLSMRLFQNREQADNTAGGNSPQMVGPSSNTSITAAINETHIFSPRLLNEFHVSFLRSVYVTEAEPHPYNLSPRDLGANYNLDGTAHVPPNLTVSGRFMATTTRPFREPENTYEYSEKLSWLHGRHAIKIGADLRRLQHNTFVQYYGGIIRIDGSYTGNAMADFVLGRPGEFQNVSVSEDYSRAWQFQPFVQDDFKVSKRLTLNLGLRWELNTPWTNIQGANSVVRPGHQSTLFPAAPPGLLFIRDPGVPDGLYPTRMKHFAPRFGFTWDVRGDGRLSVRGAFGLFYVANGAVLSSISQQNCQPYVLAVDIVPYSISNPYGSGADPFPFIPNLKNPTVQLSTGG